MPAGGGVERPLSALDSSTTQLNSSASGEIPKVDIHDIRTRQERRRREQEKAEEEGRAAETAAIKAAAEAAETARREEWARQMAAAEELRQEKEAARQAKLEADQKARELVEEAWRKEEAETEAARLKAEEAAEAERARKAGRLREEYMAKEAERQSRYQRERDEIAANFAHWDVQLLRDEYAYGELSGTILRSVKHRPAGSLRSLLAATKSRFNLHSILLLHHTFGEAGGQNVAGPGVDSVLVGRVERELAFQWQEHRAKDGSAYWRRYAGSEEIKPPEIVFQKPDQMQEPLERPIQVTAVRDDAELAAVPKGDCLWVTDSLEHAPDERPATPPKTAAERFDEAALRIQKMFRGLRARRAKGGWWRQQAAAAVVRIQAAERGRRVRARQMRRIRRELDQAVQEKAKAAAAGTVTDLFAEAKAFSAKLRAKMEASMKLTEDNEELLRYGGPGGTATPGWGLYSTGAEEYATKAKEALDEALANATGSGAIEHAVTSYANCGVFDQAYLDQANAALEAQLAHEAAAKKALLEVARGVKAAVEAVEAAFEAGPKLDPETRRRRTAVGQQLFKLNKAVGAARAEKLEELQPAIRKAVAVHTKLHAREDERTANEEAIALAAGRSLDAAFAQTVRWLFAPSDPDRSRTPMDVRHARSRKRLQARQNAPRHWAGLRQKLKVRQRSSLSKAVITAFPSVSLRFHCAQIGPLQSGGQAQAVPVGLPEGWLGQARDAARGAGLDGGGFQRALGPHLRGNRVRGLCVVALPAGAPGSGGGGGGGRLAEPGAGRAERDAAAPAGRASGRTVRDAAPDAAAAGRAGGGRAGEPAELGGGRGVAAAGGGEPVAGQDRARRGGG
eukprot:SAG22_NODE_72_length_22344_cov_95.586559_15_plen_851_part_00